jgi:hypothetical protein
LQRRVEKGALFAPLVFQRCHLQDNLLGDRVAYRSKKSPYEIPDLAWWKCQEPSEEVAVVGPAGVANSLSHPVLGLGEKPHVLPTRVHCGSPEEDLRLLKSL